MDPALDMNESPHSCCDIVSFHDKGIILPSLCCSNERFKISDLSRFPAEGLSYLDQGLLLLKRLRIADKELKAHEWRSVCGTHKKYLLQDFPLKNQCGVCFNRDQIRLKRVSARSQDLYNGEIVVGEWVCSECESLITSGESHQEKIPAGQIWVTLDNSFRVINSSVPSLRLLCRGLTNNEPLLNPPELLIKDAIEIRRSLDNSNQANKELIADKMIALGIILHYSEFRSTADACIRMLQNLLSGGDHKLNKAFRFLKLKFSAFAFLPDENKSGSSKIDQYAFLREEGICKVLCLACDEDECTGCQRPTYPSPISLGDSKGRHLHYLQTTCRCCKKRTSTFHSHPRDNTSSCSSNNCKLNYTDGFKRLCGVDIVTEDDYDVHPQAVCGGCRTYLSSATSPVMSGFPNFYPHNELFCDCDLNFFYANASVQESSSCLSVVMNFSRIPSLTSMAGTILASYTKNNWTNSNYLTVKMALEIYQTLMYVHNKKSPDSYEYFKSLALGGIIRYPIKVAFHNKANAFQTVLTVLCDSMSHSSRENRTKFRRKVETILNADFYGTEPSLRLTKKTVKFRRNFCVIVMCVICSNLICEGVCGRNPSDPSGSNPKRTKKSSSNSNDKLFRSYGKKLGLRRDLTFKEFHNYRLTGIFVPDDEINPYCVNCPSLKCKGCENTSGASQKENLKLKLHLEKLPTKKELSYYLTTGRFVFEDDLPLLNKSKKKSKSNGSSSSPNLSTKTNNDSSSSIGGSKHGEFFSHCPDCKFYFRREHIYLKHMETCYPGMNSLSCSTCQRHFKSEVGMLKHNCEGIYNLENHQFKNIALDLGSIEYDHFTCILLSHSLPQKWRALPGPKEETLVMEKESARFRFVISRYKNFSNKARLKGEGVKAFKEEVWPVVGKLAISGGEDDELEEEEEEEDEYELKCTGCHLDHFSSLSELDKHQVECLDYQNVADLLECDGCDKVFSYETEYIKHIKTCEVIEIPEDIRSFYPDDKGRIFCPGCSQVFIDDELEYFRHLKMCKLVEFENYPCKKCNLKFSTQKTLLAHDCSGSNHAKGSPPLTATITSNSKRHSTSALPQNFKLKKTRIEDLSLSNEYDNTSTTHYEPICKMGDYKCPICGLKFTLNQPYGNHVKNTMCVSLNSSVVPYEYKDIKPLGLKFAFINFNSNYDNNGSSIIMKMTYSRVPSLRLLCRGLQSPKKLIQSYKVPPLRVKDALELYQSLKKSSLKPGGKEEVLERDRLWERIRLSFYHGFGDFESFEKCLEKRKRILRCLITQIRSSSPTRIVWEHWLSKIQTFILTPLHDQFIEEVGSLSPDHENHSFKVIEYPFKSTSNCKSIIQLLCLRCWDSVCVGCSGQIHKEDYYEKDLCTISQTLFFKEFGVSCTSEELFNECTELGLSLGLKRRTSIHELIQHKRNGTQFEKGGIEKSQAVTAAAFPLQNSSYKLEQIKKKSRISALSKAVVSRMPWVIDEECILPD